MTTTPTAAALSSPAPAGAVANLTLCARLAGADLPALRLRLTGPGRRPGPVTTAEYNRAARVVNTAFTRRGLPAPLVAADL